MSLVLYQIKHEAMDNGPYQQLKCSVKYRVRQMRERLQKSFENIKQKYSKLI